MLRVAWWVTVAWAAYEACWRLLEWLGAPVGWEPGSSLLFYGLTYAVVIGFARHHLGDPWKDLVPLRPVALGLVPPVLLVTLGGLVLSYQLVTFSTAIGFFLPMAGPEPADDRPLPLATELAASALLPGLFEEALVRGVMLHALATVMSKRRAIVVSALYFSVLHFGLERLAHTFLIGLVYGWMLVRTGSLLPGVLAHVLHNAGAVLMTRFDLLPGTEGLPIPVDGDGLLPAWLGWSAVVCLIAGLWWIRRRWWRDGAAPAPPAAADPDTPLRAA